MIVAEKLGVISFYVALHYIYIYPEGKCIGQIQFLQRFGEA